MKTYKEQRLAWLQQRQTGLGGSDIAAIFGQSSFGKSKLMLYYDKVRSITLKDVQEPSGYMKTGMDLEEATLKDYERIKNTQVARGGFEIKRNPQYKYLLASLDGFDEKNNTVVEVKVVSHPDKKAMWKTPDGGYRIPNEYLLQVASYCIVTNADKADVIVRFNPTSEEVILTYERNKSLEEKIINASEVFWTKYILPKREPSISAEDYDIALKNFLPSEKVEKIVAPKGVQETAQEVIVLQQQMQKLDKALKAKKAAILQYCKDTGASALYDKTNHKFVNVIKYKGRVSFDSSRFKDENPELHGKYIKEGKPYNVLKLN